MVSIIINAYIIREWLSSNYIKINHDNNKIARVGSPSFVVQSYTYTDRIKNLSIIFDISLCSKDHINNENMLKCISYANYIIFNLTPCEPILKLVSMHLYLLVLTTATLSFNSFKSPLSLSLTPLLALLAPY